ncbi:POK6 protein, partial [Baryphthengus martii]|nr:POK6 protein [Baryphthengus martii]
KAVKRHLLQAFAVMGVPQQIKTDNGSAYRSEALHTYFQLWKIQHLFGIPYNSTGQAIVECAHHT